MAAKLIDDVEEPKVEAPVTEDVEEETLETEEVEEQPQEDDDEIPEKYRGKSAQELIRMHQEAERALGHSGNEKGELRKIIDQYILNQTVEKAPPPSAVEEDDDLNIFTDPDEYLDRKLANHPSLKALEKERETAAREKSTALLERKHPDYKEIIQDGAFAKWIQESKVRTRLFIEADQGYDADAADELLTVWKERKGIAAATAKADKESRREEVRKASSGSARGSESPPSKKIYRRADIMRLMNEDPDRYASMADEFLLAYKEKRVR